MNASTKLQTLYGLKFNPFRADVPVEALYITPQIDSFIRRMELGLAEGSFWSIVGDPGTGKSVALRIMSDRLRKVPDLMIGTLEHPQSRTSDFYRELGDLFGVSLSHHNRFAGFKALRTRWSDHLATTLRRPMLIIDEAQEALTTVLNELRVLASKELDSRQLLSVIFAGDARFPERLRTPELQPLGSRIRRRLVLEYAARDELCACLDHLLETAGNSTLMTTELKTMLAEHAAGNYRVMMNIADELLAAAVEREIQRLDEKLFLEVFAANGKPPKPNGKKR